jgi:type VI protein secretion system component Hcp
MRFPTRSLSRLVLAVALVALPGQALAATKLAMRVLDAGGTPIAGDSTIPGYAGWIDVSSLQHAVTVPIGANGQPSGAPQPSAAVIAAAWDLATVRLFQSQANGTMFQSVTVEVIDDPAAKMPMALTRLVLEDAHISSHTYGFVEAAGYFDVNMTLSFSQVTITDLVAGTSATYAWNPFSTSTPPAEDKGIVLSPSPNPTHGQTEFRFALPADSNARLELFDLRGYRVRELFNGLTSSESTVAAWDGTDESGQRVAQGVYMVRLSYPGREVTQRITVLR